MTPIIPLVSILVPIYKVEKYIERCARSLFEQTYPNLEFVFVNDMSPDKSVDILQQVITRYPKWKERITIINHPKNRGLAAARNTLVSNCHGEFVFHVDSDDWVEIDAVELLVEKQIETGADIILCKALDHMEDGTKEHKYSGWDLSKDEILSRLMKQQVSGATWHKLIRKSLYIKHHIMWDERGSRAEDWQTTPRLLYYAETVAGVGKVLYHYNLCNEASISKSVELSSLIEGAVSRRVIASFFSDKEPEYKRDSALCEINYLYRMMKQSAFQHSPKDFSIFCRLLKETCRDYWYAIGWDHYLRRAIESNYIIYSLVSYLRKSVVIQKWLEHPIRKIWSRNNSTRMCKQVRIGLK